MNKIKYILGFFLLANVYSCTDFVDPAIPYNGFDTATYLRTIASTPNINFFELNTAAFNLEIEAVDDQGGNSVQEVDVYVAKRRGQTLTPEVKIATLPKSAFASSAASKYLRASYSTTIQAALTAMGLTNADVNGGDFFEFRLDLLDTQGRRFSNLNLSPDISGGAYYRSPFFYRLPVICPSNLAGTYTVSTATPGFCGNVFNGNVRFVAGTTAGTYIVEVELDGAFVQDFSFGAYRACYGAATAPPGGANGLRLTDACGKLAFNTFASSPWGDNFTMLGVSVAGPVLTLQWETSWPPESGTSTITRTDATNWPPLSL
ncbi:MAG: hypothetical protein KF687_04150 [Cyclobacteriaceae bacterium]|nr:hypothetical protein [Cyclobacteriaceae bacterium]